jgi:hypothetical protein
MKRGTPDTDPQGRHVKIEAKIRSLYKPRNNKDYGHTMRSKERYMEHPLPDGPRKE